MALSSEPAPGFADFSKGLLMKLSEEIDQAEPSSPDKVLCSLDTKIANLLLQAAQKPGASEASTACPSLASTPRSAAGDETPLPGEFGPPGSPVAGKIGLVFSPDQVPHRLDMSLDEAQKQGGFDIRGSTLGTFWAKCIKDKPELKKVVQQ